MSMQKEQAARAASVNLDDDELPKPSSFGLLREPRTAPGQLMGLQGKYREALATIENLRKGGAADLPLSRIVRVPGRQRPLTTDERAELKANLVANPLAHPVTVLPETEAGFELLSGHNRVEIYEELGRDTIKAIVIDVEREKVEVLAFYANLLAPALPDFKKYEGLKARQQQTGFSNSQLAEESGLSTSTVSRLFQFGSLPPAAIQILEANPFILGATAADSLAKAAKAGRADLVAEAVEKLAEAAGSNENRFTEENAVAYAMGMKPTATRPPPAEPLVVKQGKKNFAKLIVRGDAVTIKFADLSITPEEWAAKLERFLKSEIGKEF